MLKKILFSLLGLILVFILFVIITVGPEFRDFLSLSRVDLNENLTVLLGYGGNSVVLHNEKDNQVLIVDTKLWGGAKKLKKVVDDLGEDREVVIVNTHSHLDHVGGNKQFPGATIITGDTDHPVPNESAKIIHLKQGDQRLVVIGSDTAYIRNVGSAHTRNDVVVYKTKLAVTPVIQALERMRRR